MAVHHCSAQLLGPVLLLLTSRLTHDFGPCEGARGNARLPQHEYRPNQDNSKATIGIAPLAQHAATVCRSSGMQSLQAHSQRLGVTPGRHRQAVAPSLRVDHLQTRHGAQLLRWHSDCLLSLL